MNAPAGFFEPTAPLAYEGPESRNPFAFRWYDKDRVVLGKRMEDHLRFAVAYWHSFTWPGGDPFGGETFLRPWMHGSDELALARAKADVAFELFRILDVPYFAFHDRDIAPEGQSLKESNANVRTIADIFARKMETSKVKLLWGTANLFSNRRFMAGAATNPDPDVFAYSAAQVKNVLEVTHELGGENYVLWGGREGYETLLNTDLKSELDHMGRFLNLVVEHKYKIGFKGTILIEPKPQEPTKHQYDFDVGTVYGLLCRAGLEKEVKLNIEANHATLAGHSFEHEIAMAAALGVFGSIDMNKGDAQSGWDTDQFPTNVEDTALAMYEILKAGGYTTGGTNFDAKIRRQSIDSDDLVLAHSAAMDVCARALLIAADMVEDGALKKAVDERYAGWQTPAAKAMLAPGASLDSIAARAEAENLDPQPRSGRQERLEALAVSYLR
ncbi:xylose isomerase [Ancylobacter defluvii]|uniref:Xylose isomerase n=1 Tax=Ancylobacter defluvii TaxID=1282440 RepID=A0A9W6K2X0_9HYPH|nr:xylose isomerase [Ancylobacter defluvii]MBS7588346.1 xylose isomerase [Ancylobacter defluvii]GLK86750.1 xylose isomerase [Ancylobacter defluvii]